MEGSELEGVLVRFRTRITKEQLIVRPAGYFPQLVRQLYLQRDMNAVGIEPHFVQLIGDALHIMRMRMTDRDHRMTPIKIQVLLTLLIPHIGPLCFHDGDVVDRINVK